MKLPASTVPRLVSEEQQIDCVAPGVKVWRPLISTELTQVPPISIDLRGRGRGIDIFFSPEGTFLHMGLLGIGLTVIGGGRDGTHLPGVSFRLKVYKGPAPNTH